MDALVAGYEGGRTVYELGGEFGVHRQSVARYLRGRGVVMRMQGLSESEMDAAAVRLYESGLTLKQVGSRVGVSAETVRHVLIERGVPRRSGHGNHGRA
ncbi:hypothetical protein ASE15_01470 [Oerskovia sp. Root22]|nr:hypothetical protein ASE15_01470 [Oerskovia sp. Root22]